MQSAQTSGLLGQLSALVRWAEADSGRAERAARCGEQLRALCGQADAADAAVDLVNAESRGDQAAGRRLRELLALQAYVEEGPSGAGQPVPTASAATTGVNAETTADYLRRRFGGSDIDVESVVHDGSGFSMYTIFVTCRVDDERRDLAATAAAAIECTGSPSGIRHHRARLGA